jgi:hypothetical protein
MLRPMVLHFKRCASIVYAASNKGTIDVKWQGLDFTLLLNPALQLLNQSKQIVVYTLGLPLHTADCYNLHAKFESDCDRPEPSAGFILGLRAAGISNLQCRAVCQGLIIVVANRGIGARELAIGWNPAPAILHQETLSLQHRKLLMRDFKSSVAEPEPQGAASFGRSRSRNAMRLRLRLRQWYLSWLGI